MKKWLFVLFPLTFLSSISIAADHPPALSDQQIKKILIEKSIGEYPGNCPCPYNTTRNGSRCGGRSAWSKKGGYAPLCYDGDVTDVMVKEYRSRKAGGR